MITLQLFGEVFLCAESEGPQEEVNVLDLERVEFHVTQVTEDREEELNVAGVGG